jgi:EmrB/QacA subfamily drug resistance transporter
VARGSGAWAPVLANDQREANVAAHGAKAAAAERRVGYRATFAVLLVSVASYALLQSLVLPVLPTIEHGLHTTQTAVTWVLTAYLLSASVATPLIGRTGDIMGKKRVLIATLATLAAGSVLAGLAQSIGVMIVARVIQGVGGAVLPLSFGIIRDEFPRERVAPAISIAAALLAVGGGVGIILSGPIVEALDYHWLFWIPAIVVALATLAAVAVIPESRNRAPGRISFLPAALLTGWLVAIILAVSEATTRGWTSPPILGLIALAIVLAVVWVRVELRVKEPVIDMRMMSIPAVWTTNLVAFLFGAAMYSAFTFLPEFLQTPPSAGYGFGASVTASGLFLAPMTVTMFLSGLGSARLAARLGSKLVVLLGSLVSVIPLAMLAFANTERWEIYLASALLGIGFGLVFAAMSNIIVESVPATQVGVASGMNANIRTIGGAIGAAAMSSIVAASATTGGLPTASGYTQGFAFLMGAAILAALACLAIPGRRRESAILAQAPAVEHGETAIVAGAGLADGLVEGE